MPIITQAQCTAICPINALVKPTEFAVCYNNVINLMAINLIGVTCLQELQQAIIDAETTPPLLEKWDNLLKDASESGGGFLNTLAWAIYVQWLKVYGRGSVVTKGFENRTAPNSEHTEIENYHRVLANVESTAKQYLAITERYLKDNKTTYDCLPVTPLNEVCKEKKVSNLPNFQVV